VLGIESSGAELLDVRVKSLAISETCDVDRLVMRREATSLSIRRVETPSR
jgi:hypothetical protein